MKNPSILMMAAALSLLSNAPPAEGSCAAPSPLNRQTNYHAARIIIDSSAQGLSASVLNGMEQWNESPCVDYLNPYPYPLFTTSNPGANTPQITIKRLPAHPLGTCGRYIAPVNNLKGEIELYDQGVNSAGTIVSCQLDDPERVSDLIAHELGHFLDLANSECLDAIMGPPTYNPNGTFSARRRVLVSECSLANYMSFTPDEQEVAQCQADPEPCTGTSPVVVDLDRNSFHFSGDPVFFDVDADGRDELISWTVGDQLDAFLCLDRNLNGRIDDGRELFGSATPMLSGAIASHGFLALAELDELPYGNLDGFLDAADGIYEELCLWIDENHDGYSDPWELQGLEEAGVTRIDLRFRESRRQDQHGNRLLYSTEVHLLRDGRVKRTSAVDVFFRLFQP